MTLTPSAKRIIDLAYTAARDLGDNFIGTEHLLCGIERSEEVAERILTRFGLQFEIMAQSLLELRKSQPVTPSAVPDRTSSTPPRSIQAAMDQFNLIPLLAGAFTTEHLFAILVADRTASAYRVLRRLVDHPHLIVAQLQWSELYEKDPALIISPPFEEIFGLAIADSASLERPLDSATLLLAILIRGDSLTARVLSAEFDITATSFRKALISSE
jgi:hypothetical protein